MQSETTVELSVEIRLFIVFVYGETMNIYFYFNYTCIDVILL